MKVCLTSHTLFWTQSSDDIVALNLLSSAGAQSAVLYVRLTCLDTAAGRQQDIDNAVNDVARIAGSKVPASIIQGVAHVEGISESVSDLYGSIGSVVQKLNVVKAIPRLFRHAWLTASLAELHGFVRSASSLLVIISPQLRLTLPASA